MELDVKMTSKPPGVPTTAMMSIFGGPLVTSNSCVNVKALQELEQKLIQQEESKRKRELAVQRKASNSERRCANTGASSSSFKSSNNPISLVKKGTYADLDDFDDLIPGAAKKPKLTSGSEAQKDRGSSSNSNSKRINGEVNNRDTMKNINVSNNRSIINLNSSPRNTNAILSNSRGSHSDYPTNKTLASLAPASNSSLKRDNAVENRLTTSHSCRPSSSLSSSSSTVTAERKGGMTRTEVEKTGISHAHNAHNSHISHKTLVAGREESNRGSLFPSSSSPASLPIKKPVDNARNVSNTSSNSNHHLVSPSTAAHPAMASLINRIRGVAPPTDASFDSRKGVGGKGGNGEERGVGTSGKMHPSGKFVDSEATRRPVVGSTHFPPHHHHTESHAALRRPGLSSLASANLPTLHGRPSSKMAGEGVREGAARRDCRVEGGGGRLGLQSMSSIYSRNGNASHRYADASQRHREVSAYDEYEDDGFIAYGSEEEEQDDEEDWRKELRRTTRYDPRKYRYEVDDTRDMESGFHDILAEESRSRRLARLEDEQAEEDERRHREEKERRRKALAGKKARNSVIM